MKDVPAILNFVLAKNGNLKAICWGFSQGTTQLFSALALNEEINEQISIFIGMAPAMKPNPVFCPNLCDATRIFGSEALYVLGTHSFFGVEELLQRTSHEGLSYLHGLAITSIIGYFLNWTIDSALANHTPQDQIILKTHICKYVYSKSSVKNVVVFNFSFSTGVKL